jgi:uncharacterized protein YjaZ
MAMQRCLLRLLLAVTAILPVQPGGAMPDPPAIDSSDVDRFLALYARSEGRPDADLLQTEYLDRGSAGLARFARLRRITGESIAAAMARRPDVYTRARHCAAELPAVAGDLETAIAKLRDLLPGTSLPAITFVIGRGRPVAAGEPQGAYIGLEAICDWATPNPDFRARAVRVAAHELVHTQQRGLASNNRQPTVLHVALVEGAAEFVTELITGAVAYQHLAPAMAGREAAFEAEFLRDIDTPAMGSRWVFNEGAGTPEQPSDLGYHIGYRIVKAYYQRAPDKRAAIVHILHMTDAQRFLTDSGWSPGMRLR